jgi:hypothetical protein
MRLEFSRQIFENISSIKFHENPSSGDGRTDMTKLTVTFPNFTNALKNSLMSGGWGYAINQFRQFIPARSVGTRTRPHEIFALLARYAAYISSYLPTFRANVSVPSSS